jgi:hypothetical protein
VATKKERIKTMSEQLEPTAPIIPDFTRGDLGDIRIQGDFQREADRKEYFEDIEKRKARSAELAAKRREQEAQPSSIDVVAELDSALGTLESAADDFEKTHLQPNYELIESRKLVAELTARLADEQAKLSAIESRGDSVQRLSTSVTFAESQLLGLLATAETEAVKALARKHYGWDIPYSKVSVEMRKEFSLHASVVSLRRFALPRHPRKSEDVEALKARLEAVGNKLAELRQHILDETSQHDTSAN